MTAVYPEHGATADELRWIAPPQTLPRPGEIVGFGAGADFPAWLASARVESARVLVARVTGSTTWDAVRDEAWRFFQSAVERPDEWTVMPDASDGASETGPDARLRAAVDTVLDGPFGEFVASHAGRIELVDAHDGVVRVRLTGTCRSCSLSDWTVRLRLERDIRAAAGSDFSRLALVR